MSDAAADPVTAPPVLKFRLALLAAAAARAEAWMRAAALLGKPPVETPGADAAALAALADSCKAAAQAISEVAKPEPGATVAVAPGALVADMAEFLAHMQAGGAVALAEGLDADAPRLIDMAAMAEAVAPVLMGLGPGRATLEPGGDDALALKSPAMASVAVAAPRVTPATEAPDAAIPLFDAKEAAAAPTRAAPTQRRMAPEASSDGSGPITAVDAPWIAVVERSPAARMILEDIAATLPIDTRIAQRLDQVTDEALSSTTLRAVVFDPDERGLDWKAALARFNAAARGGAMKTIAMTRCSTIEARAYEAAGFALVVEKPVSPQSLGKIARACAT